MKLKRVLEYSIYILLIILICYLIFSITNRNRTNEPFYTAGDGKQACPAGTSYHNTTEANCLDPCKWDPGGTFGCCCPTGSNPAPAPAPAPAPTPPPTPAPTPAPAPKCKGSSIGSRLCTNPSVHGGDCTQYYQVNSSGQAFSCQNDHNPAPLPAGQTNPPGQFRCKLGSPCTA